MSDRELDALLDRFGVPTPSAKSVLAIASPHDARSRGWRTALDRAANRNRFADDAFEAWVSAELLAVVGGDASVEMRARAAEVEAGLRLKWIGPVLRVKQTKRRTCDFRLGALNVEVYCPQEHAEELRVADALIADQLRRATGPVKVATAICHPTTGSGRMLDAAGAVVHEPKSQILNFPANALIARLLNSKRDGAQLVAGEANVLWLDLKHGLEFHATDCIPLHSEVTKGTCFVGTHGVWHAFYGREGDPLYAERTVLEYAVERGAYQQQLKGWFRAVPRASAAILSVLDGVLLWENPWASVPLDAKTRASLLTLSEMRPEFSWFDVDESILAMRVEAERSRMAWIVATGPKRS